MHRPEALTAAGQDEATVIDQQIRYCMRHGLEGIPARCLDELVKKAEYLALDFIPGLLTLPTNAFVARYCPRTFCRPDTERRRILNGNASTTIETGRYLTTVRAAKGTSLAFGPTASSRIR